MKTHLVRGAVAVATALACLLASATPASADTITFGTVVLNGSTAFGFVTLPRGTCSAGTFEMDVTASTATITAMALTRRGAVSGTPSIPFVAVVTRTGGSAGSNSSGNLSGIGLSLNIVIYTLATGTTCTIDTQVCELDVTFTLAGTFTPGFFDTVNLNASAAGLTVDPSCSSPYSGFAGGTGSVSNLFAVV